MAFCTPIVLLATSILCHLPSAVSGDSSASFLAGDAPNPVAAKQVEEVLRQELLGWSLTTPLVVHQARIKDLTETLRPTFNALPKGEDGNLDHQGVRYALHRLFVKRHGWYIRGLEPSTSAEENASFREWVPGYLQLLLEQRLDTRAGHASIGLNELAAIAAALEDLARNEATGDLKTVFSLYGFPYKGRLDGDSVEAALLTYLMAYVRGDSFKHLADVENPQEALQWFSQHYADWSISEDWMMQLAANSTADIPASNPACPDCRKGLDFDTINRVVGDAGEAFGAFNDIECRNLKQSLLEVEDSQLGRVRLSTFYQRGLYSHWQFNEKADYLRAIGALDESDKNAPRIILPNYLSSRSNCLEATSLYSVCCQNECEDLLGHLEREIAAPVGSIFQIAGLVAQLPSDTVRAPRELPPSLLARLDEIAKVHGGTNGSDVPLHGRLFAQWMHHAFPRECPYPHGAGVSVPITPDEWMQATGAADAIASHEEIHETISNDVCAIEVGLDGTMSPSPCAHEPEELLWTGAEEFYAMSQQSPTDDDGVFNGNLGKMLVCQLVLLLLLAFVFVETRLRRGFVFVSNEDLKSVASGFAALVMFGGVVFVADGLGFLHRSAFAWAMGMGVVIFVAVKIASRGERVRIKEGARAAQFHSVA